MTTPEELACINIDCQLTACDWDIQDVTKYNRYASLDVIVHKFLGGEI